MVVTLKTTLPSEEELNVQEVNLSSPVLRAGAFHLGKYCEQQNNEFMLCKSELSDPRKCVQEGKAVTGCTLEFFRKMKKFCHEEIEQYANCLDMSSTKLEFKNCRKTQGVLDKCVFDSLGLERAEYGYFCKPKVHDSKRPKPPAEPLKIYPDATPGLPADAPLPPAKYGARYIF